ncbi:hypothetical protein BGX34_010079 [Mortierella sp. NVP85]|nr:hypothetical protein BGX34_010079 [Mortierella sp. NVP85]
MNPLLLPEVVHCLGNFLLLSTPPPRDQADASFSQRTLLDCLRVCRTWNKILHPRLWQYFGNAPWAQRLSLVPSETLLKNAHHIRTLYCHPTYNIMLDLPNLVWLTLGAFPPNFSLKEDATRSRILKRCPRLRVLSWDGPEHLSPLLTRRFKNLPCLTYLQLNRWDGSGGALKRVLEPLSATLTDLVLYNIMCVESAELEGLVLPAVTSLDITLSYPATEGVGKLPGCCPKLKELKAVCDEIAIVFIYIKPDLLVDWIKDTRLDSLTSFMFQNELPIESTVEGLIQSFRTLRIFAYSGSLTQEIANLMVGYQGNNIEELTIIISQNRTFSASALATLLESCSSLQRISIACSVPVSDMMLLEAIFRGTWGCRGLKQLHLNGIKMTLPEMDQMIEPPSSFAPPTSSYIGLGWYAHSQETQGIQDLIPKQRTAFLGRLIEHVQGMPQIQDLHLNGVYYHPSSTPKQWYDHEVLY